MSRRPPRPRRPTARLPETAAAVSGVTARMALGGRPAHAGAGTAGRSGTSTPPSARPDAPTAARLLQNAHGHLRKALEAAAA